MRTNKIQRWLSILLTLTMLVGILPSAAFAAPEQEVTVQVNFDYRSVGSSEMLEACGIETPQNAQATVPAGSTVYDALEAASADGSFDAVYGNGFDGKPNGFVKAINGVGDVKELCDQMGAAYSDLLAYAGWLYTVNGKDGQGIQNDRLTEDTTITFRYSTYNYWNETSGSVYADWNFVDAYDGLKADLAAVEKLDKADYSEQQWAAVEQAAAAGTETLTAVDQDDLLASGMTLNYVAAKGSALWGPGSATDQLTKAREDLRRAVGKVVAPERITVPSDLELNVGVDYQLDYQVLPEGASQKVTFDVLLGGDAFTVSESGLIHPTKEANLCMVQVKSAEDPTIMANLKFKIKELPAPTQDERVEPLLNNIANRYADSSFEWGVMDMGAYQQTNPNGVKLTDKARQIYINEAIQSLTGNYVDEAVIFKAILALSSQGIDPRELHSMSSKTPVDAVELLHQADKSTSLWKAPYNLMVYKLGDYGTEEEVNTLLNAVLSSQSENGSWNEFGTIDTTANAVAALAMYQDDERAAAALEKGINYLSSIQMENGSFGAEKGSMWAVSNANSTALVIVGLCAAGVNPDTDPRFVKNGNSAVDGLLTFALADNSGFGYTDNERINEMSTEQAFRALIAYDQMFRTNQAYNVYDFSAVELAPASMALIDNGDGSYEIALKQPALVELPAGKPGQVVVVENEFGDKKLIKKSYVENDQIRALIDGEIVEDQSNLTIRVEDRSKAFADVKGDEWFAQAVTFTAARELFKGVNGTDFAPELPLDRAMAVTVLRSLEDGQADQQAGFVDVQEGDWFAASVNWAKANGITDGVDAEHFAPEAQLTRQELALMLYRYAELCGMDMTGRADLSGYTDCAEVDDWAAEAMEWAVHNGLMAGVGNNELAPTVVVTRAQAAQMMMKLVKALTA